jgi:hypothetical protein
LIGGRVLRLQNGGGDDDDDDDDDDVDRLITN